MKILNLKLKNLASLAGEQTIDFCKEPLDKANIFSIVGDTGSGKSTLLDAICLALYGDAPRFHDSTKIKQYTGNSFDVNKDLYATDPRNILRKGEKDGYAEVSFVVKETTYRARWSTGFNRTNYSKVTRKLYKIVNNEELEIEIGKNNDTLNRIIGLEFEQFTRTMMLAQNSFANFIKAKDEDKAKILEKVTGTEIYTRIGQEIKSFYDDALRVYLDIYNQNKIFVQYLLDEDTLKQLKEQFALLETKSKDIENKIEQTKASISWLDKRDILIKQIESISSTLKAAQTESETQAKLRQRITLYDRLLPLAPEFNEWKSCTTDIEITQHSLIEKEKLIKGLHEQLDTIAKEVEESKQTTLKAKEELEKQRPLILKAREEKTKLHNDKEIINSAKLDLEKCLEELNVLKSETEKQKRLQNNQRILLTDAENILKELEPNLRMIEKTDSIIERLRILHSLEAKHTKDKKDISIEIEGLSKETTRLNDVEKQMEANRKSLEEVTDRLNDLNDTLKEKDANKLQQIANKATVKLGDFTQIASLRQSFDNENKKVADYQQQQTTFVHQSKDLKGIKDKLEQEKAHIETLLPGMEESYHLLISKDVTILRQHLQQGKACPVCGATDHPYEKTDATKQVVLPLEKEIKSYRMRKTEIDNSLQAQPNGIIVQLNKLNEQMAAAKKSHEDSLTHIAEYETKLNTYYTQYTDAKLMQTNEINAIVLQLQEAERLAQTTLSEYLNNKKKADELQETVNKQNENYQKAYNTYHEDKNKLISRQSAIEQKKKTYETDEISVMEQRTALDADITLDKWKEEWQQNADELINRLSSLQKRYNDANEQQRKAVSETDKLTATITEIKKQDAAKEVSFKEKNERLSMLQENYRKQDMIYHKILNGQNPDEVERILNDKVTKSEQLEDMKKISLSTQKESVDKAIGEQKNLSLSLEQRKKQKDNTEKTLYEKITAFNCHLQKDAYIDMNTLQVYLNSSTDWSEHRNTIRQTDDKITDCKATLRTNTEMLKSHDKEIAATEKTHEELNEEKAKEEISKEEINAQKAETDARLRQHENSERQIASIRDELKKEEKNKDNWEDLYKTLVGNNTADKFRESAQTYTLGFLVNEANIQLRRLNPRYSLLQFADSLTLQVIDHDRADTVRNISSLSGGETFLVSLSLALALSMLSSRNLSFSNIFIDEGFGTLDTNSLNTVIDTLSSLQSMQGKKVGVISHTAEMRDRIPTQIRINKSGMDGKSTIEIV